jgi:hypothetical protein
VLFNNDTDGKKGKNTRFALIQRQNMRFALIYRQNARLTARLAATVKRITDDKIII